MSTNRPRVSCWEYLFVAQPEEGDIAVDGPKRGEWKDAFERAIADVEASLAANKRLGAVLTTEDRQILTEYLAQVKAQCWTPERNELVKRRVH